MDASTKEGKLALIKKFSPPSRVLKNSILAAFTGGVICMLGELLGGVYLSFTNDPKLSSSLVSITLIIAASILTALGVFDKVARFAGAGTLVPVTGFSNSVTSSAIDSRSEGFISGVGSKIFTVAGPVILFSTVAGTVYGLIYYIVGLFI